MTEDADTLESNRICSPCVGEDFLSGLVVKDGVADVCSYCGRHDKTLALGDVADLVEGAFERHYVRTSTQPDDWQMAALRDPESDYDWSREGQPVVDAIADAARLPQEAAEDIQEILSDRHDDFDMATAGYETAFGGESHYEEKRPEPGAWMAEWEAFETALKTNTRFFSQSAAKHLESVFAGIEVLGTFEGSPLIVEAGPGGNPTSLYRARVFQAEEPLLEALKRPDAELGSPPARLAPAGRMNARGISVFYGATDAETAIAEVRPPVGSRVAVARFEIVRPLRLLDLAALQAVHISGSIFDRSYGQALSRAAFLRTLTARITRPVMPDDADLEYLATQAVADFLAASEAKLDGIAFPSVQSGGGARNVVLFHKAARVAAINLPEGAWISATSGDWWGDHFELDYQVAVSLPPAAPAKPPDDVETPHPRGNLAFLKDLWTPSDPDEREPALEVRLDEIDVHHVGAVTYKTNPSPVRRSVHPRWTRPSPDEPF